MAINMEVGRAHLRASHDVIRGKAVTVTVYEGSYAASRLRKEVRDVDRAVGVLGKLLKQPVPAEFLPVAVTIEESLPSGTATTTPVGLTLAAPTPETAPGYLVAAVLRHILAQWLNEAPLRAPFVASGLIELVTSSLNISPSLSAAEAAARDALNSESGLSITALWDQADQPLLAHAFAAYLIDGAAGHQLRELLAKYDPARRDEAALQIYQTPLAALWSGWLAHLQRKSSSGSALGSLLSYVGAEYKPYWKTQAEIFFYMAVSLACGLSFPIGSKYLLDTVLPAKDVQLLAMVIGAMLCVEVINSLVGLRRTYVSSWLNGHVTNQLQDRVFKHLQKLPHSFFANARVGDLLARLSGDVQVIQGALAQILGTGVFLSLRLVVVVITMITLNPMLGVVMIVAVPIFTSIYFGLRSRLQGASKRLRTLHGDMSATTQESLSAHSVIKAFGLEGRISEKYQSKLGSLLDATLGVVVVGSLFETSVSVASAVGQLIILGIGGYLVLNDQATVGTLLALISLLPSVFQPIAMLSNIAQTVEQASGSLDRFKELLETPVEIEDREDAQEVTTIKDGISFKSVDFSYEKGRPILAGLDLELTAGKHIAVVGPSGSGKSTIINLLMRFWDPDQGSVSIDGVDVRDIRLSSLRKMMGIVFQDTFVFDTTLRENIAIGRPDASDEEVLAAARAAQLDSYIASLPEGINTELGERGVRMSGGQRQRLAIARVILRNPRLLILDEATSALDAQTERDILETFLDLAHGRTTISITHRLTLAAAADWIVVINKGKVAEQGTHEELLRQGGLYHALYNEQYGKPTGRLLRSEEAAMLRTIPVFSTLSDSGLATLVSNVVTEYFAADSVIVRQGDPGDKLYFIKQGQVEVSVRYGETEHVITRLGQNDYFGEMTLLSMHHRTATVRAVTATELYTLTHADFLTILGQNEELREGVAGTLTSRQEELQEVLVAHPVTS